MTLREDHFVTVANLWARTQEVIEASGHLCIFLPKFHCELNFTEYFWGAIKKFQRDHCAYTFKTLQEHLPKALESVAAAARQSESGSIGCGVGWKYMIMGWKLVWCSSCPKVQLTKIQVTPTGPGGYET